MDWNEESFQLQQQIEKQMALSLLSDGKKTSSRKPFSGPAPLLLETQKNMISALSKKEELPVFVGQVGILRGTGLNSSSSLSPVDRPFFDVAKDNHLNVSSSKSVHAVVESKAQDYLKEREGSREPVPRPYISKRERAMKTDVSNTFDKKTERPVDIISPVSPHNSHSFLFESVALKGNESSFQVEKKEGFPPQVFQGGRGNDDLKANLKTKGSGRGEEQGGERKGRKKRKGERKAVVEGKTSSKIEQLDYGVLELRERREKEIRLREAGWVRDGFGNWFRDSNVEFDSDEETPCV